MSFFAIVKDQQIRKDIEEAIASQMIITTAVPSFIMITRERLAVSVKNQLVEDELLDPTK